MTAKTRTVELGGWDGPWDADDPDANFKADVALYSHVDPMATIGQLAAAVKIPEGAVVHYVLAKWASAGSGGLLELGPSWSTGFGPRSNTPNGSGPTQPGWRPTPSSTKCSRGSGFPSSTADKLPGTDSRWGTTRAQGA
jgi:hypothetical protein